MSELVLTGATDPGELVMSILAIKGDPGITPDLTPYETITGAQALANAAAAQAVATVLGGAGAAYDTLGELQAILTSDENAAAALTTLVGTKAPINNPTFTGTVNAPAVILSTGVVTPYVGEVAGTGSYLTFNAAAAAQVETRVATNIGLIVKGATSQSADLQQWRNSAGTVLANVTSTGGLVATAAGFNALGVYGTAAATVVSTFRGAASQSANLTEWQNSAGALYAKMDQNGVLSANGLNTGGSGSFGGGNLGGTILSISTGAATNVGVIVRGFTAQSADFQQWQSNAGTVLASVNAVGVFAGRAATFTATGTTDTNLFVQGIASQSTALTAFKAGASATGDLMQFLNSGGTARLRVNFDGSIVGSNAASHSLGSSTQIANNTLAVYATGTSGVPLIVKTVASQSADMQQWQDSAGLNRATVNNDGSFYSNPSSATTVAYIAKAAVSQSASIQEWRDSSGAQLTRIGSDGAFGRGSSYLLSPNTSLANLLVASATSSVVLATRAVSGQTADYQQWQDGSGLTRVRISAGGQMGIEPTALATATPSDASSAQLAFGTAYWNGTASTNEYGYIQASRQGGTPTTAGQFRIAFSHNTNPDNAGLALMMDGSKTATIGFGFGSPADGQLFVNTTLATRVGLKVRGTPAQSADIQQWADSGNGVLARVTFDGTIKAPFFSASSRFTSDAGIFGGAATESLSAAASYGFRSYSTSLATVVIKATASQTADIQQVQDSAGAILVKIGSAGFLAADMGLRARPDSAPSVGFTVKAQASQSGDLTQWQDSAGTAVALVRANGKIAHKNMVLNLAGTFTDPGDRFAMQITGNYPATFSNTTAYGIQIAVTNVASQATHHSVWSRPLVDGAGVIVGAANAYYAEAPLTTNGGTFTATYGFTNTGGYTYAAWLRGQTVLEGFATAVPVAIIKAQASQTADLLQWQDSTGAVIGKIGADGSTRITTALPGITPLVVKAAAAQTADLLQWQDSSSSVLALITATGRAQFTNVTAGLTGVTSRFGDATAATISGAAVGISPNSGASTIPLIIKGAASQSADMTQWQNNAGTVIGKIGPDGQQSIITTSLTQTAFTIKQGLNGQWGTGNAIELIAKAGDGVTDFTALKVDGLGRTTLRAYNAFSTPLQVLDSTGVQVFSVGPTGGIYTAQGIDFNNTYISGAGLKTNQFGFIALNTGGASTSANTAYSTAILSLSPSAAGNIGQVIRGAASQSADLQQWQDSAGVVKASLNSAGAITVSALTVPVLNVGNDIRATFGVHGGGLTTAASAMGTRTWSDTLIGFVVRAWSATQSASLMEWQTSASVALSKIKANGEYESAVAGNAASDAGGGTGGIVLKSPDGTRYRVTVANGGTLTVTAA